MNKDVFVKDLVNNCGGQLIWGSLDTVLDNFSKDTRTIAKGDVYIGIKGENFDGNLLYEEALEKGAKGCILNDSLNIDKNIQNKYPNTFIVVVKNTVEAIQKLAHIKRKLYDIPVIAITGSVGKTSTKDIVASVLSKKFKVLKTMGNLNNHLGVPLTILSLKDHDALVIELGMNHLKEIALLSKICEPTLGIITNIGTAHIGNLGSRENILKAKLEILEGMQDRVLVINNDNDLLHNYYLNNKQAKIITFGINNQSDYMATNIVNNKYSSSYTINLNAKECNIKINIPGNHFILNSLCAIAVGKYFDIDFDDISKAIENFVLTSRRMEINNINDVLIINDSYNANLDSMESAINYLGSLKDTRKIALLGDMLELGTYSEELHKMVGKCLVDNHIDVLLTIGNETKYIIDECLKLGFNKDNIYSFKSNEEVITFLNNFLQKNDTLLIKASYGMHFFEIFDAIKDNINC